MTSNASAVARRVTSERPTFHVTDRETTHGPKGTPISWSALAQTLEFIAHQAPRCRATLEIGSGASTVVFASAGTDHIAISPVGGEHERISAYCDSIGVSTHHVTFVADSSDRVLPTLDPSRRFDLVFLDGTHSFPYAIIEWHYLRRHLDVGGLLLMDDVPIPAIAVLHRFLKSDPAWERVAIVDGRTVAFRKIAETGEETWRDQPFNNGYPELAFLPLAKRAEARARHWHRVTRNRMSAVPRLREAYRRLTG
jgi:predicted O-methyltransferase YrrM